MLANELRFLFQSTPTPNSLNPQYRAEDEEFGDWNSKVLKSIASFPRHFTFLKCYFCFFALTVVDVNK